MNQWATKKIRDFFTSSSALLMYAALTCFTVSMLCIALTKQDHFAHIWLTNAILLIFIFRSDTSLTWKFVTIGFVTNLIANYLSGTAIYASLIYSISNSIEVIIPVLCIARKNNEPIQIVCFNRQTIILGISIPICCVLSSIFASTASTHANIENTMAFALEWIAIDFLAMTTLLPFGLIISKERILKLIQTKKLIEFALTISMTVIITTIVLQYIPIRYIIILIPILFSALRLGLLGTTLIEIAVVTAFIISISYVQHVTPLYSSMQQFVTLNSILMSLLLLPGLITAALIEQRMEFEDKLRENEERFRGAIQYSAIGMSLVSPDGTWMVVNPALCEITGYSENELLRMTFQQITYPPDLQRDLEYLDKVVRREIPSYTMEKRYIKKNGERVWISLVVSGVYDHDGKLMYFVAQIENITMRKRMEYALQESEQRWKFALEGGNQGVWDWNITTNSIYYSRTWKIMLGYEDEEIGNTPEEWFSRIHPEEMSTLKNELNQHLSGKSDDFHFEHQIRCKNGMYKWFLVSGKVITRLIDGTAERIIGTFTDIDLIKQSEAETEKMTERLQMAIDSGKIGIFNYNINHDNLIWDDRMYEIYDVDRNEFSGNFEAWESRVHPEDYQQSLDTFSQALSGIKPFNTEFRIIIKSGEIRWIKARAQVLRDRSGKAVTMLGMNWDITNEKQLVHDLYTEKERLNTTLKAIGDAVIVTDADGTINFINAVAEQLIGCNAKVAIGKSLYDICKIISESTGELLENPIEICLKKKVNHYLKEEGVLINHIGSRYFIQDSAAPIILPSGEIAGCVLVLQDVTINRNLQTELKHQATHDVLTGLINRREIESKIRTLISSIRTTKNSNCLFFIDLDDFKLVNDTAGHPAGDELLRRVAEMLSKTVRTTDTVARLGGDEFAVILPECTLEDGTTIAKSLIDKIRSYSFIWENKVYEIGASVGLVNFKSKEITLEALLSQADIACYTAKSLGGNRVSIFEGISSDASKYLAEIQMGPKIKKAVDTYSFILHTQEIRPLQDNIHLKSYYEILLRMIDESGNIISPSTFIKSAERQNLMPKIDCWVIKQILVDHADEFITHPHLNISINISAASINSPDFHRTLDKYLSETIINKSQIGFEIKETAFANDIETAQAFLLILEKHGCFVSMENFGKGLSAMQHLKRVPMLYIKIDGNYIRGIVSNSVERAIVESINQLAHKLGARTVAEFVESAAIMQAAREIGIDYAQGFAIGKSRPLNDIFTNSTVPSPEKD